MGWLGQQLGMYEVPDFCGGPGDPKRLVFRMPTRRDVETFRSRPESPALVHGACDRIYCLGAELLVEVDGRPVMDDRYELIERWSSPVRKIMLLALQELLEAMDPKDLA